MSDKSGDDLRSSPLPHNGHAPNAASGMPAGVDPISGALNLAGFGQQYARIIASKRYQRLALWFLDIRNFRSFNPRYGFMGGNAVLTTVAQHIREVLSHELPVARLGGDRFILLTEGLDLTQANERFEQLTAAIDNSLAEQGIRQHIVLMAGIYLFHEADYENPSFQQPLDYVSAAHRNARLNPKSRLVPFTNEDLERDLRRIAIEQGIDEAVQQGQIEVWYQPLIDYTLGEVIGAEALARWHHPTLGLIAPDEFVPVLEACGKIHMLDTYVLEEACKNAGRWRDAANGNPVPISVNISRSEVAQPGLVEHLLDLREQYNLPADSIRLELTEGAFLDDEERLYGFIDQMHRHNLLIEMDDFGSSHSSINVLDDVHVDVVKLDMDLLRSASTDERSAIVLGSVIRMLQGLDTPIIAEGIETLEQAEILKNMGCHLMQGFYFSHPMPLEEFEGYMASNHTVEHAERRERKSSHLDGLLSIDPASSFIFNHAMGGTMFFTTVDGTAESILANDQFFEECGLNRADFANTVVGPLTEIDPMSFDTMWRAVAQARERGSATCTAKVRRSQRWIECVVRYLDTSSRGNIYSLNIVRSGFDGDAEANSRQALDDLSWDVEMLDSIVPNGTVKCHANEMLDVSYLSPQFLSECGLSNTEFVSRFHNSLREIIRPDDRNNFADALYESRMTEAAVSCDLRLSCGYANEYRNARAICRYREDHEGEAWLYCLFLFYDNGLKRQADAQEPSIERNLTFVYDMAKDRLTIEIPQRGNRKAFTRVREHLTEVLDKMPDNLTKASAAKLLAIIRDLETHPIAGFTDIKCAMPGENQMRWYHISYTCDTNANGTTRLIQGSIHDANDQMGSTTWWRQQAERDQLTGLLNRNAVEQAINLAMRTQGNGMMFMIDLDGFKRVNDELGHLAGDALLRDVAHAISGCFREGDIIGRYGGDEFVAFMCVNASDAPAFAARRAQAIIDSVGRVRAKDSTQATCSVGVAIAHDRTYTFYNLLEVADKAMYQSKEGRKGTYTIVDMA